MRTQSENSEKNWRKCRPFKEEIKIEMKKLIRYLYDCKNKKLIMINEINYFKK